MPHTASPVLSLEDRRIAALSGMVLDIPPRVRCVLLIAAVIGVGVVVMQSLVGHQAGTIRVDRIIHFSGYAILALAFVMSLRPALFLPVLAALLGIGLAIEYFQPLMGREGDARDMVANLLGIAVGAGGGLLARSVYAWLRRDLALAQVARKTVSCRAGTLLIQQGDPVPAIHIIQSGQAKISRLVNGHETLRATLGPGDVFGLLGMLQGTPQFVTVTAETPMTLYRLTLDELIESCGGASQPAVPVLQASARLVRALAHRIASLEASHDAPGTREMA